MRLTPLRTPYRNDNLLTKKTYTNTGEAPVTVDDVKKWSRVDFGAEDVLISDLIDEVIDNVENHYNFTIVDKTVTAYYEEFSERIALPFAPVKAISSVKTIDEGTETTLTADDDYRLQGDILYLDNIYYAQDPWYKVNLEVVYTTGWDSLPTGIKIGLKKAFSSDYSDRQDLVGGMSVQELPNGSKSKFNNYRNY